MLKLASWFLVILMWCPLDMIAAPALPVVQVLDAVTQKHLCTGALIDKMRVLTARHCLSSSDGRRYTVTHPELKFTSGVDRVHFYENDSRHFPNRDLALLDISKAVEQPVQILELDPIKLHAGIKVKAYGRGYHNEQMDSKDVGSLKAIDGSLGRMYNGFRVENLAIFKARNQALCVGDSGGPILAQQGEKNYLIGWVNGLWDPLTNSEGFCAKETVITLMAPYASWIHSPKSRPATVSPDQTFHSLEKACRKRNLSSAQDLLIQKILLQLIDTEVNRERKLAILLRCEGADQAWETFIGTGKALTVDFQTDIRGMIFLHSLKSLELSNVTQANIKDLSEFHSLEKLALNGSTQLTDLKGLKIRTLKTLSLKNIRHLQGIQSFLSDHSNLNNVSLLDVQNKESPILFSWFAQLKQLKYLKIGMTPIKQDLVLPGHVSIRIL